MKDLSLNADEIANHQAEWTERWHEAFTPSRAGLPWAAIEQNHRMNFDLWHEEDMARRDDLGADRVRQAKRAIDRCNQSRNDAIEQLDLWLEAQLPSASATSPQHSETPGMIIDRLSIMALKIYHMKIEALRETAPEEQRNRCREKLAILERQRHDLKACLETFLQELQAGTRHFKLYRQFKMYNDATLNPQLYSQKPPA